MFEIKCECKYWLSGSFMPEIELNTFAAFWSVKKITFATSINVR